MHYPTAFESETDTLHITNDTSTATKISEAGIPGETLAWQDALYEGPVIADDNLMAVSNRRVEYFSDLGWGNADELKNRFNERNKKILEFSRYRDIILWFDHDLYDQLQMLQLIAWFDNQKLGNTTLNLICIDRYPGVKHFYGLSSLTVEQLTSLYQSRLEVTGKQYSICKNVWKVFTSNSPNRLLKTFPNDMTSLPFLKNAVARLIKQFPSQTNGLSQTEFIFLTALSQHISDPEEIYMFIQSKEPVPFMSRAMFFGYLQQLMYCKTPLIEKIPEEDVVEDVIDSGEVLVETQLSLQASAIARQVYNNWVDWVQINGINRWIGGVHLQEGNVWRYNKNTRQLNRTYS